MIPTRVSFPLANVRTAGLLAVTAIAVLSLVPGDLRLDVPIGFSAFRRVSDPSSIAVDRLLQLEPGRHNSPMSLYALVLE